MRFAGTVLGGAARLVAAPLVAGMLVSGCAALDPTPTPAGTTSPSPVRSSAAPSPTRSAPLPADGVSLAQLGFDNGPLATFSLPRAALVSARVDQENNVALVLVAPSAAEIAGYLRRALPAAGFSITADDPGTDTMTFSGNGWRGSFTGEGSASAVLLRPAS